MLQKDLLLPHKKIIDNVSLPLVLKGMKKAEAREKANPLFAEFGLQQVEITQLSAARGKIVGCYTMMTANNPVFILSGKGDKYGE